MVDSYKARKNEVLRIYDEYRLYKDKYRDTVSIETLEKRAKNIRDGKFFLMVAGEAKGGKSTFINAFLGAEILPMDVKQCTSALIQITYGEKPRLETVYADNRRDSKEGEEEIRRFLKNNAALQDEYREIPVTAINNELLVKSCGNIKESEINDLIEGVKNDNTFNLEPHEYERRIRHYY